MVEETGKKRKGKASPQGESSVSNDTIRNIVVVSDTHVGCCLGLAHPDGASLDDGGHYQPSKIQRKLWDYWEQFWGEWVPRVTHGEPYSIVLNGDLIDGVHHNSTTQWTHNCTDQGRHATKILAPLRDMCEGRLYVIRGTEAHVGKSAREEEIVAREIGAIPDKEGRYSRWELWKRLGPHLIHFLHHIGNTSSSAHESSAVNAELSAIYTDCGRWGQEAPAIVVRSHRHRCIEVRLPARGHYATVFVTAAWQLKTPFAYKIAGARVTTPQIGGSLIRLGDEELHTRHCVWDIGRTPEE